MKKKNKKGFKIVTIMFSFLTILVCLLVATLGVLDIAEVLPMYDLKIHHYTYIFHDSLNSVIFQRTYKKGESFDGEISEQFKESEVNYNEVTDRDDKIYLETIYSEFTFKGWDINNDGICDLIPQKAYFDVSAYPVFDKKDTVTRELIYES